MPINPDDEMAEEKRLIEAIRRGWLNEAEAEDLRNLSAEEEMPIAELMHCVDPPRPAAEEQFLRLRRLLAGEEE